MTAIVSLASLMPAGSGQIIGPLFPDSRPGPAHRALQLHKGPCGKGCGAISEKGITQLQGLNRHKNSLQPGQAAQKELLSTRHGLGQERHGGTRMRPCMRRLYHSQRTPTGQFLSSRPWAAAPQASPTILGGLCPHTSHSITFLNLVKFGCEPPLTRKMRKSITILSGVGSYKDLLGGS